MKNGIYKVTIGFQFENFESENDAIDGMIASLQAMRDNDESPEVDFECLEEFDTDYTEEEEEVEELDFEVAS